MNLIKANKILLVLAFFLPFCVSMCSRTDFINGQKEVFEIPKQEPEPTAQHSVILGYIIHPTEHTISGVGLSYYLVRDGVGEFSLLLLVPVCLLLNAISFLVLFSRAKRLLLYLSILSFCSFSTLGFKVLCGDGQGFVWGFWFAFALNTFDVILLIWKRNTSS